jgi:hypothetical protein
MPMDSGDRLPSATPGGQPQEEDASGSGRLAGRDEKMESERLNPGSGHGSTPGSTDAPERDTFNGGEA